MVRIYQKGRMSFLSEHFVSTNFDCHCIRPECTTTLIDDMLFPALEKLRELAGPFVIDRGYSCPAHNAEVGGVPGSQHPKGKAADCKSTRGLSGSALAVFAEQVPVFAKGGIGTYPTFCHVDVRGYPARWGKMLRC